MTLLDVIILLVGAGLCAAFGARLAALGDSPAARYVLALVGILGGLLLGAVVGRWLGGLVTRVLVRGRLGVLDRAVGALAGAASALAGSGRGLRRPGTCSGGAPGRYPGRPDRCPVRAVDPVEQLTRPNTAGRSPPGDQPVGNGRLANVPEHSGMVRERCRAAYRLDAADRRLSPDGG